MFMQLKPLNPLTTLRKLVLARFRQARIPVQATLRGFQPSTRPWYIALLRTCAETILITISSIALGIVFLMILHYLGVEGSMNHRP
jgi:hypothetical protein